jgi:isopenicillin-N epimerase
VVEPEPANPLWGDDWPEVASSWPLDRSVVFLNHGSFGATPWPVLDSQLTLRNELERDPVAFMTRRLPDLAAEARTRVGSFLGADPEGLAFVANATTGVSTVLASLAGGLRAGDRVVTTDHAYPAVRNALARTCELAGADLVEVHIPLPLPKDDDIVDAVSSALTERTRLLLVDHVTSPSGAILPVGGIVRACRTAAVPVMIDGAHAPGMLPVDVDALGADFWTGNLHKWVCAPKGSAVLWVAEAQRDRIRPLVTSHGAGRGFRAEFDWTGTHDPTPYLAAPAAIAFMEGLGWDRVMRHNHALAVYGRDTVASAIGTEEQVDPERFGSMSLVAVPAGIAPDADRALAFQEQLFAEHRIEVPVMSWDGRGFVRLSAQVYNAPLEYDRLGSALATMAV